ncbi:uncharacterized protein LOC118413562 [Branchiostoma floridae]|uniref:Uncharacterized protein LOC118413562 n=1 Tax=Branchiostoma floridae TaxID=7739 RepID=A0A9J7MN86_BRAFL|nr:uncharacterized protein LOC118413562 [Branchiostoma floridae]
MGCGGSTAAAPHGTTIGTQTDRSFVARQKDKEAIEASSGNAKTPRRQLRPLGRGPDLNAIEADARKTLQPANVLPSIKHAGVNDGTTQRNTVLPLYHPPLPQISSERKAGGSSQEATATGSQGKPVVANGTETLIVIPDETFDSSDDDLSSMDEADGYGYSNGAEKVGITSIVGTQSGNHHGETGGQNGKNSTDVSPTKMFSLGAKDTVITSDELIRDSKVNNTETVTNSTVSGTNDATVVAAKAEESQTTQNAAQQVNAPSGNGPVPDRSDNADNNPPEKNASAQENNNNSSPTGPVELLLQNGDTLKKIHVGDNFSVAVNIVVQAVDPTSVLQNDQAGAEQNGVVGINSVSLAKNVVKVVNSVQPAATASAHDEQNVPVPGKNLSELTGNSECSETVVSNEITNNTTDENVNLNKNNAIDAKSLPEVIVTDHEDSEGQTQRAVTDQILDNATGKQRKMIQLLCGFDLKKKLEERREIRKHTDELQNNAEGRSSNGDVKEQNLSNETIEGKIPDPNVPQRKRAAVLGKEQISLFKHIEVHAVYHALEPPKAADTFASHVKVLLSDDLSDLEKVRMLFHWVTAQNLQDMTFGDDVVEDSPLGNLKAIKEGKGTCAKLFEQLCCAAGLKCHVIKGYKKGEDCLPDHDFHAHRKQHRGTWNAVMVDGEWRLVDCHWAARGVRAIEENGEAIENVNDVYKYEEFYFLTDPEDLIDTHFPDCPEWQLLEKYLTITQFQSRVRRWPMFHRLGLELKSHRAVVVIPAGDFVELSVGFSKEKRKEFRIVYQLKTKEGGTEVDGISLNRYVIQETCDSNENFLIDVPKSGEPNGIKSFPVVQDAQFGTRQPYFSDLGLIENENASYFLTSDNGEVEVQLENPHQKQIMYSLTLETKNGIEKFNQYTLAQALGDKTVLLLHLPQVGEYALQLFAKDTQGRQRNVVNYCISCDAAKEDCKPFPRHNNSWGPVYSTFSDLGLALDVPQRPYVISRSGKYNVSLAMTQPLLLRHHLFHCAGETRENMDDFAFCETIRHKATVTTCFPKAGDYCLEIYGTTFPPSHDDLPLVATFFMRCLHPLETGCRTFPQIIGRMWGPGCCLYEPLAGVLSRDKEVTFRVDVPDADDVVLKSPDSVTDMSKDQSGTWTGSYVPRESDTSLLLLGKFDKNVNRYVGLLEFKFDS